MALNDGEFTRRDVLKGAAALAAASALPSMSFAEKTRSATENVQLLDTREQLFDSGWRFHLGDVRGAERPEFNDAAWRELDLPHDWSIEDLPPRTTGSDAAIWAAEDVPARIGPFDRDLSPGQMATGYVVGGTGWYRKKFSIAHLPAGKQIEVRFDGVYMNADVWVNGQHLGIHPYGYTAFAYDLTPHLHRNGENVIAVRVRNEGKNSRWYSGSGIYRHAWLTQTGDVRVPLWGVSVLTPEVSAVNATVTVDIKIENRSKTSQDATVRVTLIDHDGKKAVTHDKEQQIGAGATANVEQILPVPSPALWSPDSPKLYRAEVRILLNGKVADTVEATFGIRKIEVDAENGLRINGEPLKLRGGCLHHDNGVLGSACIDRSEERRVELMKANGFNAIRTSHNPPSPAFLDACDRFGVLVIDEAFDMWEAGNKNPQDYHLYFDEWWERDLRSMVLRDRNHPSVIMWSIGNEIHERADPRGVEIAGNLVNTIKQLDKSRPVTMAVCSFWDYPGRKWEEVQPAFLQLDVAGYNYALSEYESDHAKYPNRVIAATETFPLEAFENQHAAEKYSYVIGDFVWTGMDYLGETGIGHSVLEGDPDGFNGKYPWFNAYCGDIDLIGDKKPQSYFRDVVWGRSKLEMAVQRPLPPGRKEKVSRWGWSDELRSWTWPGHEGEELNVRVYSSGDQVRLLLNGKEVATKSVSAETKLTAEFAVPYAAGELKAVALRDGKELSTMTLRTVGKPAKLFVKIDRKQINSSRNDLAYVTVEVHDAQGNLVPDGTVPVKFAIDGAGEIAAVGNANPKDVASFRKPERRTFHGKCLAVLRPTGNRGTMTLQASSEGLASAVATVRIA